MYGEAVRIGLGGGTGGVKEDEDAEVAGKLAAFQVDVFGRGVASTQVDGQVDEGVDVEIVAIGSATDDLGAEAQAGQASAEQLVVLNTRGRDVRGRDQWEVDDPAPLRSVPVVVYVPLRIEGATHANGRAGPAARCEAERNGERPGVRPHAVHSPDRPNRRLTAGSAVTRGTGHAEQLVEEVREAVRVEEWVLE